MLRPINGYDNEESERKEQITIEKFKHNFQSEPFDEIHPTLFFLSGRRNESHR